MKEWKPKTVNMENGKAGHTCCPLLPFIGFQRSQPACCLSHPFLRLTGEHRIYPTGRAHEESPSSTELIHISSSSSSSFAVWYWHGGCKLEIRLGISHHTSAYWSFAVFFVGFFSVCKWCPTKKHTSGVYYAQTSKHDSFNTSEKYQRN